MLKQGVQAALDLENGALATVWRLTVAPGRVVRDVWRGRTVPYVSPVRYFLVAFTVAQLVAWQLGFHEQVVAGFVEAQADGESPMTVTRAEALNFLGEWFLVMVAVGLPLPILASRLLLRGRGRTVAEHAVHHLYVVPHMALLVVAAPAVGGFVPGADGLVLLALPWYVAAGVQAFGGSRWKTAALATLAFLLSVFLYVALLGMGVGAFEAVRSSQGG